MPRAGTNCGIPFGRRGRSISRPAGSMLGEAGINTDELDAFIKGAHAPR
jgi:hypothetical protein